MKCGGGEETKQKTPAATGALPKEDVFNRELGVDVLEIKDSSGHRFSCLNVIDMGTTFQQVIVLVDGGGMPSSQQCVDGFVDRWVSGAGWPKSMVFDRGPHNRGQFSKLFAQHGVVIRQAGVESPEQIGRVERHGGLWKAIMKRVVTDHAVLGLALIHLFRRRPTCAVQSV